ncbi:mitochondrial ribosomal protein L27-domain-containing protein [Delphinella strobiligena]|nr:mitochondrial ribosomal protein L27-domain-containing protein [Delphinella strobiligena]
MVFTPTQPLARALRRLALTTKQANKGFYKGTGSGSMGSHTKWGGYKIDINKVRTYKVPDLADFPLTPFVAKNITPEKGRFEASSPLSGSDYLERWKAEGGTA